MTELEEKFYKVMGIEPIFNFCTVCEHRFENTECNLCDKKDVLEYPPITDHILLELLVILSKYELSIETVYFIMAESIDTLKEAKIIAKQSNNEPKSLFILLLLLC